MSLIWEMLKLLSQEPFPRKGAVDGLRVVG